MRAKSFAGMQCSIAGALELIGDKWAFLVIRDLSFGLHRYDALQSSTEIPAATLSARLKHLTVSGIVQRVRYQEHPPRDEYRLTQKGEGLWKVCVSLREWGDQWDASGCGAQPIETIDRETGRSLVLSLVDAETNIPVAPERMLLRPGPGADEFTRTILTRENGVSR